MNENDSLTGPLRELFEQFLEMTVQALALRMALGHHGIIPNLEIEEWCSKLRQSEAVLAARRDLRALDHIALLRELKASGSIQ